MSLYQNDNTAHINGVSNKEMVKMLLYKKANVNAINKYSYTPLMLAAYRGNEEIVRKLIDAGADVNFKNVKGDRLYLLQVQTGKRR